MDYSNIQTEDNEIKEILEEYGRQNENYINNKNLQTQLENTAALYFTKNVESIVDKLFCVTVKICDSISDFQVLDFCNNKEIELLDNKMKYYVVQIYVSHIFDCRLLNNNWIANVCIKSDQITMYQSVSLNKLVPHEIFNIVVPFSKSSKPVSIKTRFLCLSGGSYCPNIEISSIKTNISYHFVPLRECNTLKPSRNSILFEISKLYTENMKLKPVEPDFDYTFSCKSDVRHFYEIILKNCIHRLDINQMQILSTSIDEVTDLYLSENDSETTLTLDTKNKILKISSTIEILNRIKKFLIENMNEDKNITVDSSFLVRLQNLRMQLQIEKEQKITYFENIKVIYQEYKNLVAELPL